MNFVSLAKGLKDNPVTHFPWIERIIICLAVLVSYASVWPNSFLFDDKHLIVLNVFLRDWSSLPKLLTSLNVAGSGFSNGFYRPLPMLVYFFIYQAFGASTVAFHALNVTLQALNGCLLHHFGIRAGFRKEAAFAAALLWTVHPLHTADVAYMSSSQELLWSTFCLWGLIALLPDFTPRKIWRALILFMLALGCKESAVVFPALAAITFFYVSRDRAQFSAYLKMWPLWLLGLGYTALQLFMHKSGYTMDDTGSPAYSSGFATRVLTALATLPVYARLIVWPAGLHLERVFPVFTTLLAWQPATGLLMAGSGLVAILRLCRNKYSSAAGVQGLALSFGVLWFAAALSPYTGIVMPIDALISEGWMYMPTMGLFLGGAQLAAGLFNKTRQNAALPFVLLLALLLGIATFMQNETWRNPETLYQNILQNGGRVDRVADHVALYHMEQREFDKAIRQSRYALDHPDGRPQAMWADTHFLLAMAWLQVRVDENDIFTVDEVMRALPSCTHIAEAIGELGKALQDNPAYYQAHVVLSAIYRYQRNNQMADFHDRKAREILHKYGGN